MYITGLIRYYNENVSWNTLILKPNRIVFRLMLVILIIAAIASFYFSYFKHIYYPFYLTIIYSFLYISIIQYLLYKQLRTYGYTEFSMMIKVLKTDPFREFQRKMIKNYLIKENLRNQKIIEVLVNGLKDKIKTPNSSISFWALLISIIFMPIYSRIIDYYFSKNKIDPTEYLITLIGCAILSIFLIFVSVQSRIEYLNIKDNENFHLRHLIEILDETYIDIEKESIISEADLS